MKIPLTRALVLLHRWLGVALSLFVAAWFASGIILIYVPFPSLPAAERVASRADIPLADVRVSPAAAIAALGEASLPDGLRLVARGGRPVYLLHQRTRRAKRVWNYFGAVTHWIYPSVLRRHWAAWDRLVWWLALAGVVVSISGLWLGIDRRRRTARAKTGRLLSVPTLRAEQIDRLRNSRLPESAVRLILDDQASTWVHVDAATGRILSIMGRRRRLNRWLFNGLHSLDFSSFTERRPHDAG